MPLRTHFQHSRERLGVKVSTFCSCYALVVLHTAGGPALAPRPLPAPLAELHPALTSYEAAEELLGEDPRWSRLPADQR
jgi:hypothetical protein